MSQGKTSAIRRQTPRKGRQRKISDFKLTSNLNVQEHKYFLNALRFSRGTSSGANLRVSGSAAVNLG